MSALIQRLLVATQEQIMNMDSTDPNAAYSFYHSHSFTAHHEGGYTGRKGLKADTGGETLFGIARNFNQKWSGWPIVDELAATASSVADLKTRVETSSLLFFKAAALLYTNYYRPTVDLTIIPSLAATVIYDFAVHAGPARAKKTLQKTISQLTGTYLNPDGKIGPLSRTEIDKYFKRNTAGTTIITLRNNFVVLYTAKRIKYYEEGSSIYKASFISRANACKDFVL